MSDNEQQRPKNIPINLLKNDEVDKKEETLKLG